MKNLLTALHAVMNQAGYVQKTGKNTFHNYRYAGEADLLGVIRPAMIEHGLLLIGPQVEGEERTDDHGNVYVTLTWTIAHISGEVWPEKIRVIGCGNDKSAKTGTIGDKGLYKAYTGAVKYMLFKLLLIATGDDPENEAASEYAPGQNDGEAATRGKASKAEAKQEPSDKANPAQLSKIAATMAEIKMTREQAIAYFGTHFGGKTSRAELTKAEASKFIEHLESCKAVA